jgi:hypothetical protein
MTRNRPIDLPEALYGKLADTDFHIFHHIPALILVSTEPTGPWLETDRALAGQNLMLDAAAERLGAIVGYSKEPTAPAAHTSVRAK